MAPSPRRLRGAGDGGRRLRLAGQQDPDRGGRARFRRRWWWRRRDREREQQRERDGWDLAGRYGWRQRGTGNRRREPGGRRHDGLGRWDHRRRGGCGAGGRQRRSNRRRRHRRLDHPRQHLDSHRARARSVRRRRQRHRRVLRVPEQPGWRVRPPAQAGPRRRPVRLQPQQSAHPAVRPEGVRIRRVVLALRQLRRVGDQRHAELPRRARRARP